MKGEFSMRRTPPPFLYPATSSPRYKVLINEAAPLHPAELPDATLSILLSSDHYFASPSEQRREVQMLVWTSDPSRSILRGKTPMSLGFSSATDGVVRNDRLVVPPCLGDQMPLFGFQ